MSERRLDGGGSVLPCLVVADMGRLHGNLMPWANHPQTSRPFGVRTSPLSLTGPGSREVEHRHRRQEIWHSQ